MKIKNLFKLALCSLVLMSSTNIVWGQTATVRNCSTMDQLEQRMAADPSIELAMEEIERQTEEAIANGTTAERAVITIPTVVHVVYKTNAQNISEAQIQSQMQVLNDDFRRMNSDANNVWSQAADTEIEFCLASVDPNGNPTNGITRTYTNTTSFSGDAVKYDNQGGKSAWPRGSYLNMWVCNLGGGILGYAQFPNSGSAATDGVVIGYNYFGTTGAATAPFDGGRTTTHEVGHWLNLYHIWGDGGCNVDDNVSDTPSSDAANYGCATGHVSCNSTDMVQNYMDYSDDACMNLFTAGQRTRMRAVLTGNGFRASLQNSLGCGTSTATCDDGIQNQGETGIDCGGPCAACVTCNDGIQNQGETGIDCGGPCAACPTCNDGIQNQGEEGVDCGGPCNNACPEPTCDDGIQNGDELGVDCGGANCPECAADACAYYGSGPWDFIPAPTACGMNNAVNETQYQVWDNESYIFELNANTDYNFNFCNGYNPNVWAGNLTVWSLIFDGTNLYFDTAISVAAGCSIDFTTNADNSYYLVVVNSEGSACDANITTTETDNGYAQIYCVDGNTGGGCGMATGLEAVNFTATGVTLQWDAQADAQAYQIAGRKAGGNWKVFPQQTNNFRTFSSGIQPNTNYEWTVRVLCDGNWTEWILPPASFSTAATRFGQATSSFDLFADAQALTSNVYHNPATDKVTVSFTTANEGTAQVRVLDLAGRTILSAQHEASNFVNEVELSTAQLESGYYFVEVISGTERSVSKLNIIK